jgi:hypothetical protein
MVKFHDNIAMIGNCFGINLKKLDSYSHTVTFHIYLHQRLATLFLHNNNL